LSYRPNEAEDYTLQAGDLHPRPLESAVRILLVVLVSLVSGGCGGGEPGAGQETSGLALPAEGPIRVVATLAPLAWTVEGRDFKRDVELTVLMPEGVSPHGWEPSPSDALALSKAHLILVANEEDEAAVRRMGVPEGARVLKLRITKEYHGDHPWLDRTLMNILATQVGDVIDEVVFDGCRLPASAWNASYERLRNEPGLIKDVLVVTSHDAWSDFFGWFVPETLAVRGHHHDEPSPSHLAEVRKRALEADKVLAVFEPGEEDVWLRALAEEVGAATVTLDPVGTRDWLGDMHKRYDAVVAALESLE